MNLVIVRPNGDLKREEWSFSLNIEWTGRACIYLQDYSFQTRLTTRHKKWVKQTFWNRIMKRENNIDTPPIPSDVEEEMRTHYQKLIMELPICK